MHARPPLPPHDCRYQTAFERYLEHGLEPWPASRTWYCLTPVIELMGVHVEHMPEMDDEDEYAVTQGPTCYCLRAKLTTDRSDCHQ